MAVVALVGAALVLQAPSDPLVGSGDAARQHSTDPAGPSRRARPAPTRAAHPRPAARVTVALATNRPTVALPRSFLGFSTEYWTLPVDENHVALYRRVIALVHDGGDGRFVLRIGGVSSDHSFWELAVHRVPDWAFAITPRWIARTAQIVRQSRLRVIIDLNLVTATPALNTVLAREAIAELPRGSVAAFEIGNEPDLYNRQVWGYRLGDDREAVELLPRSLTASTYAGRFDTDARSLGIVAPQVPLQGPALADPLRSRGWILRLLSSPHPRLDAISVHEYPYTACAASSAAAYPTIAKLLSPQATRIMANAVTPAVALGRRFSLPVRVSEFNSVTCGGVAGVSNSFATALWAPSALFSLVRAGVSSAELHVRAFSINAPFSFAHNGVRPRPLLYGLVLFARMTGPGSRLVGVRVHAQRGAALRVWAVSQPGRRLNVLLINGAGRPVKVDLTLPSRRRATIQRLLAASPRATSGETLDGQRLGPDLRWIGRRHVETVARHDGHFAITVRGVSAAMITVALRKPRTPRLISPRFTRGSAARRARCRGCGRPGRGH